MTPLISVSVFSRQAHIPIPVHGEECGEVLRPTNFAFVFFFLAPPIQEWCQAAPVHPAGAEFIVDSIDDFAKVEPSESNGL